jgi:hypothetical protein
MAHTIRIDDDVYYWLHSKAEALGDTPNAFLRQIAEQENPELRAKRQKEALRYLDTPPAPGEQLKGRILNNKWNVNAVLPLYHPLGQRFKKLDRFPAALIDAHGYLRFETEKDYHNCPGLHIAEDTWAPKGISSIPRYIRMI